MNSKFVHGKGPLIFRIN